MSLLGYARVSTAEQNTQAQVDALNAAGAERVFADTASGLRADRPALAELLATAQEGDTVVVARLDRLGRSLPELLRLVEDLTGRGVALRSLGEQIDTSTAAGRLVLHVFGALAEFERAVMRERTVAGLAAARARGRVGGRRPALKGARLSHAQQLRAQGVPVWEIAQLLGVGRSTVYRTLGENPAAVPNVDLADCDEISGDLVAPGSLPPHLTIADLERAGMAAKALDNPQVMRRAWE